jgi:hypothetical protein
MHLTLHSSLRSSRQEAHQPSMSGRLSRLIHIIGPTPAAAIMSIERNRSVMPTNATVICAMCEASASSVRAQPKMRSPRVTALAWGKIEVEGAGTFRDAKLFPGGAREWDWRETGTKHTPGIQPADVRELLAHGATTIVLSQGMLKRLGICPETLELLKAARRGCACATDARCRRPL